MLLLIISIQLKKSHGIAEKNKHERKGLCNSHLIEIKLYCLDDGLSTADFHTHLDIQAIMGYSQKWPFRSGL